jgi:hypothetical protein
LTKELELSREQALEISMIIQKQEKTREELEKATHEAIRGLRHELGKEEPSEKNLKEYIADAVSSRDKMKDDMGKMRDKVLSKLSVTQQAKFILFHAKWMKKLGRIREHIRDERGRKRGQRGQRMGRDSLGRGKTN